MKKLTVKIIGSGPTGSLLALALASLDIKVDIYDIVPLEIIAVNNRTYAITHSSRKILENIYGI